MPAAQVLGHLVGHGVGGQRDDRGARPAARPPRARGSRGWRSGRPSPASARPSGSGPSRRCSQASTASAAVARPCTARRRSGRSRVFSTSWLTRVVLGRQHAQRRPRRRAAAARGRRRRGRSRARRRRAASGRSTVKVEPSPGVALDLDRRRPSARPARGRWPGPGPCRRSGGWSRRRPGRTSRTGRASCSGGDADAGVGDRQPQRRRRRARRVTRTSPALGELQGVGDQVVEDLAHPRRVAAVDAARAALDVQVEGEALLVGQRR